MSESSPLSAIEQLRAERRLAVRLERETSQASQRGCALLLGLLLFTLGAGIVWAMTHERPDAKNNWVGYVVGFGFGGFGALLLVFYVHQLLASRVQETIVEMDSDHVTPGEPSKICFRQEGPVSLHSLRANVICMERTWEWVKRGDGRGGQRLVQEPRERQSFELNVLDEHELTVPAEEIWEKTVEFSLPPDAELSCDEQPREVIWKLEVWGQVARWPDFMHPFPIRVASRHSDNIPTNDVDDPRE